MFVHWQRHKLKKIYIVCNCVHIYIYVLSICHIVIVIIICQWILFTHHILWRYNVEELNYNMYIPLHTPNSMCSTPSPYPSWHCCNLFLNFVLGLCSISLGYGYEMQATFAFQFNHSHRDCWIQNPSNRNRYDMIVETWEDEDVQCGTL